MKVLAKKRDRCARSGKEHKTKIINELVELFDCHRKAAIRALQARPAVAAPFVLGRPREYDPDQLRPPLKAIWLAALQPCGVRLKACLPDWLPAYEEDHRRLNADVRRALLQAGRATLDRLLIPARIEPRRQATTRPGTLLHHQIPIRTEWVEPQAGLLEMASPPAKPPDHVQMLTPFAAGQILPTAKFLFILTPRTHGNSI